MDGVIKPGKLPRILVLGDAIAPTGFARVIYKIFTPLCEYFEIHQMGVNYQGGEHNWPWTIYPAMEKDSPFGINKVEQLADQLKPSIIFMVSVDVILAEWIKRISNWKGRSHTKVIVYCPVDTNPLKYAVASALLKSDRLFTYTRFGQQCFTECIARESSTNQMQVEIMPHGVDTAIFHPLENDIHYHLSPEGRIRAKRMLVGENDTQLDNSFIVLNANRNEERKRLDTTIRGFARFVSGKPDSVRLYLHCGVKDLGWNVLDLANQEGIMDRLVFSTTEGIKPAFPDEEINRIFNACEAGINTSSAEGWGLVNFEHAAAGAAQLVPNHTGCTELWKDHAILLNPSVSIIRPDDLKEYYIISPDIVANSLERIYQDKDYYHAMCIAAYNNATQDDYNWDNISQRWGKIFIEELAKLRHLTIHEDKKSTEIYRGD